MDVKIAERLHRTIMAGITMIDDRQASEGVELFPELKRTNALIRAGTRINWCGALKRAAVDLWDVEGNDPDNAPGLWEDVAYREGYRVIPDTITSTLAFAMDEIGWWKGVLYRSKMNGNVYTPDATPTVWEVIE